MTFRRLRRARRDGRNGWGGLHVALQFGEIEVVEHFAPGLRGVEFPPDRHEIRNGAVPLRAAKRGRGRR